MKFLGQIMFLGICIAAGVFTGYLGYSAKDWELWAVMGFCVLSEVSGFIQGLED